MTDEDAARAAIALPHLPAESTDLDEVSSNLLPAGLLDPLASRAVGLLEADTRGDASLSLAPGASVAAGITAANLLTAPPPSKGTVQNVNDYLEAYNQGVLRNEAFVSTKVDAARKKAQEEIQKHLDKLVRRKKEITEDTIKHMHFANRQIGNTILSSGGALVTECAIGARDFKEDVVEEDKNKETTLKQLDEMTDQAALEERKKISTIYTYRAIPTSYPKHNRKHSDINMATERNVLPSFTIVIHSVFIRGAGVRSGQTNEDNDNTMMSMLQEGTEYALRVRVGVLGSNGKGEFRPRKEEEKIFSGNRYDAY